MNGPYDDIIDLPHHTSSTRARMSNLDRAAQFSPFAALSGYDAAIRECTRLTDQRSELDECRKAALNATLQAILEQIHRSPQVTVIHFLPDLKKDGGAYVQTTGHVKKIDPIAGLILFTDGRAIPIEQLYDIRLE